MENHEGNKWSGVIWKILNEKTAYDVDRAKKSSQNDLFVFRDYFADILVRKRNNRRSNIEWSQNHTLDPVFHMYLALIQKQWENSNWHKVEHVSDISVDQAAKIVFKNLSLGQLHDY